MVMARVVQFVKRAPRGFLFCRWDMLSIFIQLILISFLPVALCASDAEVYEIGVEVDGNDENLMWVDRNPYFDAALTLFHVVDTEEHDDHYLLPYAFVAFLLAFFIRHNPVTQAFGRVDVETIHHNVLTRALQWINDTIEDRMT